MTSERRPQLAERRRRVIYAHGLDGSNRPSASAVRGSREARRPAAAYGSRVHRRLRARWFGLVPVRRRTLTLVVSIVGGLAVLLTFAHWATLVWAPLAYAPDLARPLQLNRPDSFGTWLGAMLLLSAAGASLLIYQLRRYRSDDYEGRYRIWRPIILILAVASLDTVVGIVPWCGHLLDACLGERKALAGGDWIRLALAVGGILLTLRMLAEVRQSRLAMIAVGLGALMFAYPALVHWKILAVDSAFTNSFYYGAPLLGRAAVWIAAIAYVRWLYRDVRQINEKDRLADRVRNLKVVRLWNAEAEDEAESEDKPVRKTNKRAASRQSPAKTPNRRSTAASASNAEAAEDNEAEAEQPEPKPRRRWFGLRKPAAEATQADDASTQQAEEEDQDSQSPQTKRKRLKQRAQNDSSQRDKETQQDADSSAEDEARPKKKGFFSRFSLRLPPPAETGEEESAGAETGSDQADSQADDGSGDPPEAKKRRFGLGWFKKRDRAESAESDEKDENAEADRPAAKQTAQQPPKPPNAPAAEPSQEEDIDPDSIDWNSLSKAERRRLKRQLKRQGKAA